MNTMQDEVMPISTEENTGVNINIESVIKVARKFLSDEDNVKLHQMLTSLGESERLTRAISFVSKRHPMTIADWIREITS